MDKWSPTHHAGLNIVLVWVIWRMEAPSDTETPEVYRYPFVKWDGKAVQDEYEYKVATALESLQHIDMTAIHNSLEAKRLVNMQCNELNIFIRNSSESAMFDRPDNYMGRYRWVPWWRTNCTVGGRQDAF